MNWRDLYGKILNKMKRKSNAFPNETLRIQIGGNQSMESTSKETPFNKIKTTEYSLLTFLPMNLLNQFRRIANCYFLVVTIIAFFLKNCPISPLAIMIPLIVVLTVGLIKPIPEFYYRRKFDQRVNRRMVSVIRQGKPMSIESQFIAPGDLVVMKKDIDVPCDLILLQTENPHGKCFVTTTNIDGETNLTTLHTPHGLSTLSLEDLKQGLGEIECEPSNADLYTFNGKLKIGNEVLPLNSENLLLYGARSKDPSVIIGCAVYLGMQTKLQMSLRARKHKFSTSEKYINRYVLGVVATVIIIVTLFYFLGRNQEFFVVPLMAYLGPPIDPNKAFEVFDEYFSLLVLFNYMIPVLLYAYVEIYRFFGALFLRWDLQLYDEATDEKCLVRNSDLIEELGQINFLLTDKSGTLTKNEMTLKQCSINGRKFNFEKNFLREMEIGEVYDIRRFEPSQEAFFLALSLCHTVQVSGKSPPREGTIFADLNDNQIELDMTNPLGEGASRVSYQAKSADDKALVEACSEIGLTYLGDDDGFLRVSLKRSEFETNELILERLHTLEFSSERKRMSVIVEDTSGIKWLYAKGAECSILPLCINNENELLVRTNEHITEFSRKGLRTLALARKQLEEGEYENFLRLLQMADDSLERRQELREKAFAAVECDLELLGATAVEDLLQDNIAATLVSLRLAGIKVWMLTGDKVETALSVATSSGHITSETEKHFFLNCSNKLELLEKFEEATKSLDEGVNCALVLDSESLNTILNETPMEFLDISVKCTALIGCRLLPFQKGQIVNLLKKTPQQFIVAAVGDGANDVAMLQEANIGIAIFSKEGRQAIGGCDYAIAKFSMLKRLLLVHGHFNVSRLTLLILYFFYESVLIAGCMLMFQFDAMFSGTSVYNYLFLALYTTLYNSLPIMILSCTEKPHSEETLIKYPELYTRIRRYRTICWPVFLLWSVDGFIHAVQIYLAAYFVFSTNDVILNVSQTAGLSCFGILLMQVVVIVANLKLLLESKYMSYWYLGSLVFSILLFVVSTLIDNFVNNVNEPGMYWAYNNILSSLPAWLFTIFGTVACLMPDFTLRYLRESFRLPKTWSFAQSGIVRTLQDFNILSSDELADR